MEQIASSITETKVELRTQERMNIVNSIDALHLVEQSTLRYGFDLQMKDAIVSSIAYTDMVSRLTESGQNESGASARRCY